MCSSLFLTRIRLAIPTVSYYQVGNVQCHFSISQNPSCRVSDFSTGWNPGVSFHGRRFLSHPSLLIPNSFSPPPPNYSRTLFLTLPLPAPPHPHRAPAVQLWGPSHRTVWCHTGVSLSLLEHNVVPISCSSRDVGRRWVLRGKVCFPLLDFFLSFKSILRQETDRKERGKRDGYMYVSHEEEENSGN